MIDTTQAALVWQSSTHSCVYNKSKLIVLLNKAKCGSKWDSNVLRLGTDWWNTHSRVCFIQGQPIHLEWNPFKTWDRRVRVRERSEAHLSHADRFKREITSVCYGCSFLPASVKNTQLRSREAPWGMFTGWDAVTPLPTPTPFSQLSCSIQQRGGEGQSLQITCTAGALRKQCKSLPEAGNFVF